MKKNRPKDQGGLLGLQGALFVPSSDWRPRAEFPDLRREKLIGFDIETFDPHLTTHGPGFLRGDARVVGFSVAVKDRSWYYPFGHLGGGNLDPAACTAYARDLLAWNEGYVVGANLQYEIGGMRSLGVPLARRTLDVQIAEALIDEEAPSNRLAVLCQKYLGAGKDETLLREAASAYGVDPKNGLWKLHSRYVGGYAEFDAATPLAILEKQLAILRAEGTEAVFQMEMELLPILQEMTAQGIPMDLAAADRLLVQLKKQEGELRRTVRQLAGRDVNENSGREIARVCADRGLGYPSTEAGAPSFTAPFLDAATDPFLVAINELRECFNLRSKYVEGWIHKYQIKGRIHPQWRQCASDEGGTRTGRMAAGNPNPQQIPGGKYKTTGQPNPTGQAIRACFVSDTGLWGKLDFKAQEPRLAVHYANLLNCTGIKQLVAECQADKDLYDFMIEATGQDRDPAKTMFMARIGGMGSKGIGRRMGCSTEEAEALLTTFDNALPFLKELADACRRTAEERGYIRTILGRRRHFDFWEPREYGRMTPSETPLRRDAARAHWGPALRRTATYKALISLTQGSGADMTKAALIKIRRETNVIPYLQVHDEIDFPARDEAHAQAAKKLAEGAVAMTVPIRADLFLGKHWK